MLGVVLENLAVEEPGTSKSNICGHICVNPRILLLTLCSQINCCFSFFSSACLPNFGGLLILVA